MSKAQSAICLIVDRLSAAYVGALGNTWIHTPGFDQLAAQSLVFDRAMTDSPSVEGVCQSFWTGTPAWMSAHTAAAQQATLLRCCREHETPTLLVSDDEKVVSHPLAAAFDEIIHFPLAETGQQAGEWEETQLAAFFAAAGELLGERRPPALVWLHTGALGRVWDSPQALRDRYAAEDDPRALATIEPPSLTLAGGVDPDLLLGLRHAYAGEVAVLDLCLSTLVAAIDGSAWREALLVLASARGYPLGEHGVVGDAGEALYGELLRVPWFVRAPGLTKYGTRSHALVQPVDLCDTLCDWISRSDGTMQRPARPLAGNSLLDLAGAERQSRALAVARNSTGETALATPAWFVRARAPDVNAQHETMSADAGDAAALVELFVKPDDYFEANEVSNRCQDVADEFQQILRAVDRAAEQGVSPDIALSEAAKHGLEAQVVH